MGVQKCTSFFCSKMCVGGVFRFVGAVLYYIAKQCNFCGKEYHPCVETD